MHSILGYCPKMLMTAEEYFLQEYIDEEESRVFLTHNELREYLRKDNYSFEEERCDNSYTGFRGYCYTRKVGDFAQKISINDIDEFSSPMVEVSLSYGGVIFYNVKKCNYEVELLDGGTLSFNFGIFVKTSQTILKELRYSYREKKNDKR